MGQMLYFTYCRVLLASIVLQSHFNLIGLVLWATRQTRARALGAEAYEIQILPFMGPQPRGSQS